MRNPIASRLAVIAAVPIALLGAAIVSADGAPGDARATIAEVEAKRPAPSTSGNPVAVRAWASAEAPLIEAKQALERAQALRAKGDVARAEIAEATALEWAQAARDELAAVEDGAEADALKAQADDAGSKAERARQLLDEAIARRSRLQGSLDDLDREAQLRAADAGAPGAKKKGGKP
jgi:multidrug resistance efflux pump